MHTLFEYIDESTVDPELICHICYSPLQNPFCTSCGETFCRECIVNWIEKQSSHCPHCRQSLTVENLIPAPRSLRNMLDRLQIKCSVCGQIGIEQANFVEHIQRICPNTIVHCPAANIQCSWSGQRHELNEHLLNCQFELTRPVIIQLTEENQQLKQRIIQQKSQILEQLKEIQQLKQQIVTFQNNQLGKFENLFQYHVIRNLNIISSIRSQLECEYIIFFDTARLWWMHVS